MSGRQPRVLVAASTWWPLSARLAMALRASGCKVDVVCPPGHPLLAISGIGRHFAYHRSDSLNALRLAIIEAEPELLIPCDDGVVWQLQALQTDVPVLRGLIERSLGPPSIHSVINSRERLLDVAAELGIRVPRVRKIDSREDLDAWFSGGFDRGVLKLDHSWGGRGVQIAGSRKEALRIWQKFSKPLATAVAWKRWFINHDVLALWIWRNRSQPVVTIHEYIGGQPANTMLACWRGEVLSLVTAKVLCSQGQTGAATVVELTRNAEIERAARLLAKRLHLTGFHGLDFILEQASGAAHLIEWNPRCTQLGHLHLPDQASLATTFSVALGASPRPNLIVPVRSETVAFFPGACTWQPTSPYLQTGHHDVPWEEPQLVRELLADSWPNRQWPARMYHALRASQRRKPVSFEALVAARP
jgi:hypothetical protein